MLPEAAILPLPFPPPLLKQLRRGGTGGTLPGAAQGLDRLPKAGGAVEDASHSHLGAGRFKSHLVSRFDPDLIPDPLRDYDLAFRPHPVSHTESITRYVRQFVLPIIG